MEAEDADCCTAHNLSLADTRELRNIVQRVVDSGGADAEALFSRFSQIVTHYQEQPQLLDPLLEVLVRPLAEVLLTLAGPDGSAAGDKDVAPRLCATARLLWQLAVARGYKTILRFLPNEVAALEPVAAALAALSASPSAAQYWEAQYTLVMWLSLLAMVPFDLTLIDSSLGGAPAIETGTPATCPPIAARLIRTCQDFLSSPASTREMAAVLVGRLVTRPDMHAALDEYLAWAAAALTEAVQTSTGDAAATYDPKAAFLVPGVTLSLATIFKLGARGALVRQALTALPLSSTLLSSPAAASSALVRKLAVKLAERAGLTLLPQRPAPWRYQRGQRSLASSTPSHAPAAARDGSGSDVSTPAWEGGSGSGQGAEEAEEGYDNDDDDAWAGDPEQAQGVEAAIEVMLAGLGDKDTVVRWSAAKGLGRITGRLPRALGDEVVAAVLGTFTSPVAGDAAWHGGCLALAELTRRGLLLPRCLSEAVPFVIQALEYDVRRGHYSVGAHVRDAAAYVCWAIARAYSPATLGAAAHALAPALITTACYDREVNCRRAAAAAFQECVGRLGAFPYGIEILTAADYFTVSMRTAAYLKVGPLVASYPGYLEPLAWHLLHSKLCHWEKSLRELAAAAVAALVPLRPSFFQQDALRYLLPLCTAAALETRHGAVAAVAELLPALQAAAVLADGGGGAGWLAEGEAAAVAGIIPDLERLKLTRGKGGEVMRSAVCRLIETMAETHLALSTEQLAAAHAAARENLHHPAAEIQRASARALAALVEAYFSHNEETNNGDDAEVDRLVTSLLHDVQPTSAVTSRRGAALALGDLPPWALRLRGKEVVSALAAATQLEAQADLRDVETRVNAANSLPHATLSAWGALDQLDSDGAGQVQAQVLAPLLAAMEDYSTDNRGDVGSWVREAAMHAAHAVVCALGAASAARSPAVAASAAAALFLTMRLAVERITKLREKAGRLLPSLAALCVAAEVLGADQIAATVDGIPPEDYFTGLALPAMARLLSVPAAQEPLLQGLTYSIGGLEAQLTEIVAEAVVNAIDAVDTVQQEGIAAAFLTVWTRSVQAPRLATPLLITAEILLSRTSLQENLRPPASQSDFLPRLLGLTRAEVAGCTDVSRLHAASAVLCQLASVTQGALQRDCLVAAVGLVGNRYPKVRRYAAEQLYTALLAWDPVGSGGEEGGDYGAGAWGEWGGVVYVDGAMQLLEETAWDGAAEVVRPARVALCGLLGLPPPLVRQGARSADALAVEAEVRAFKAHRDENASYRALLDHEQRGL